jgi:glutathione S-transferase
LGTAVTSISQMKWSGVGFRDNAYLLRSAERLPHLLGWLEGQLDDAASGFLPGCLSLQDIFLACHLRFVENRPLDLDPRLADFPKIAALLARLDQRPSFRECPIWWWEPGVTGYESDGTPVYAR